MQAEVPAVVAATGGSVGYGAILFFEHRREREMLRSRRAYQLTFPVGTDARDAEAALAGLSGISYKMEIVAETVASEDGIRHLLHIPERIAGSVTGQLQGVLPGLRVEAVEVRSSGPVTTAVRIVVPVHALLRTEGPAEATRALLAGMSGLRNTERVSLRFALRPGGEAPVPDQPSKRPTSMALNAQLKASRARIGQPGFTVAGMLLVRAKTPDRARVLAEHVVAVLRSRRGPSHGLIMRRGQVREGFVMPWTGRRRGWLSAAELLPLLSLPIGSEAIPGVELAPGRRLLAPPTLAQKGRRLFIGEDRNGARPVALDTVAACHHMAALGPAGVGKSVLLARAICDDVAAGYGGIVVDPKRDLITTLLEHIRPEDADRIVVLDPSLPGPVPGLNFFAAGDPDMRADVLLGALEGIYRDSFGVRAQTYIRLGARTLGEMGGEAVLLDWIRLFTEPKFRRQAVARLRDPLAVAAWRTFDALSPAEQMNHIAAPMNRITSLLSRPALRNVISQPGAKLDIGRLLAERRWLFVSLAPGVLSEPGARLLGAVVSYCAWAAVESRSAIPEERRRPVFLYFDELQSLSSLPLGLENLFERARGLKAGVTVATQGLGRLNDSTRRSLLTNCLTLIAFRQDYDNARTISRELGVEPNDLQRLDRFHCIARVASGIGSSGHVVSGHSEPLPKPTGQATRILAASAERYGREPADIEADLVRRSGLVVQPTLPLEPTEVSSEEDPLGRSRR